MLGAERLRSLADTVFAASQASQTEVLVLGGDSSLTRFANNAIHQNVSERDAEVRVRAVTGTRVGVASGNSLDEQALRRLAQTALDIATRQPENPDFPGLPSPRPLADVPAFVQATAEHTPAARAAAVKVVCDLAAEQACRAFGAYSVSVSEIGVFSTTGVAAYAQATSATLKSVVMADEDGSGYAQQTVMDADQVDPEALAREAVGTAARSRRPIDLEPGDYSVFLEEYAVGELLEYLAYIGFSALAVQEGRSFMGEAFGKPVASPLVSIWDDGLDHAGLPNAFDFEGMPKRRVTFLDAGVAREVVYDTQTAHRDGRETTGHALPAPNTLGPMPWNMFIASGARPRQEILRSMDRGLWVRRFHYVNVVHPLQTVLTGMTRDGTFLVERGELTKPVRNLRFTQSALGALAAVREVSQERRLISEEFGSTLVPGVLCDSFRFTGATAG